MRAFSVFRTVNVRRPTQSAFTTVQAHDIVHASSLVFGEDVTYLTSVGSALGIVPDESSLIVYAPNGDWLGDVTPIG